MEDFNLPLIATCAIGIIYLGLLVLVFRGARFDRKLELLLTGFLTVSIFLTGLLGLEHTCAITRFRVDVITRLLY